MAVLVPLLELPPLELPPLEVLPLPEPDVLPPLEPDVVSVTPSSNRTQDAAAAKPKEEIAAQPNTYFRREPEKTASVMMQRLSWARRGDALFETLAPRLRMKRCSWSNACTLLYWILPVLQPTCKGRRATGTRPVRPQGTPSSVSGRRQKNTVVCDGSTPAGAALIAYVGRCGKSILSTLGRAAIAPARGVFYRTTRSDGFSIARAPARHALREREAS